MNSCRFRWDDPQRRIRESLTPESHAALPTRGRQFIREVATLASRVRNGQLKMENGQ